MSKRPRQPIKSAKIVGSTSVDDVVMFVISVHTAETTWLTIKRYSQFSEFHDLLLETVDENNLPPGACLPEKKFKWWYSHNDRDFIQERALLLDNYLAKLISIPPIAQSDLLIGFLALDHAPDITHTPYISTRQKINDYEFPEDVEVTDISIATVRIVGDHVLYQIDVSNHRIRKSFQRWTVLKRFSQFIDLDYQLRREFESQPQILAEFPPTPERYSKWIIDHLDPHFIEHRRLVLENYIQRLLLINAVVYNDTFLNFVSAGH